MDPCSLKLSQTVYDADKKNADRNNAGIRKLSGTKLINDKTGEILYTLPDNPTVIINLLKSEPKIRESIINSFYYFSI